MVAEEIGKTKIIVCKKRIKNIQKEIHLHESEILKLQQQELEQWTEIVRVKELLAGSD